MRRTDAPPHTRPQELPIDHRRLLLSRDRLNQAPRSAVARLCVRLFDLIQSQPKEHQLLALAGAFVLAAEAFKFSAQDAFQAVKNLMADPTTSTGLGVQFDAMKWHLEEELAHDS